MSLHSPEFSNPKSANPLLSSHQDEPTLPPSLRDLLNASAYPHPVDTITLKETHISWIVLTGPYAYKIKKPVHYEFLDTSTLERRRQLCEEELRLNRQLAPSLYLDVVPIRHLGADRLTIDGRGPVVEYAVQMKQFDADDELVSLLKREAVTYRDMHALADCISGFHLEAPRVIAEATDTEPLQRAISENLDQLTAELERTDSFETVRRLRQWTHTTMAELADEFKKRSRYGFVRECHGDLHAANIVRIDGRLVPFDCIEFDTALRSVDVMSDVAFLVMDLHSYDRADLAAAFLSRYLEVTGDYEGLLLLPFYAVYRALVRAKVDWIAAETVPANRADYLLRLHRRLDAASEWTRARRGALLIMHGVSASGKSWFSEQLIARLAAIRVRSDLERKRIAAPEAIRTTSRAELYSKLSTHRTYSRLLDCAEFGLLAGFNMIVDATFLEHSDRELFHSLADASGSSFTIVSCHADEATLQKRLATRMQDALEPSDADVGVLEGQLRNAQPLIDAEHQYCVEVDTADPEAVTSAWARLESRVIR